MTEKTKIAPQFQAIMKRELIDGKASLFYVPAIIFTILVGFLLVKLLAGNDLVKLGHSLKSTLIEWDGLDSDRQEVARYLFSGIYGSFTLPLWVGFPFVVFFSLLGSLYEDRRDKSILFWKSMPVSDAQEVLIKFFTFTFVAFGIFCVFSIALQVVLVGAAVISFGAKGAPLDLVFPIMQIAEMTVRVFFAALIFLLWTLPVLTWLLLVSSYAPRMPFVFAILPPIVLVVMESILFDTTYLGQFIEDYIVMGFKESLEATAQALNFNPYANLTMDNPRDVAKILSIIKDFSVLDVFINSIKTVKFWVGLILSGGFIWGAIQFRKRSH